MDNEAYKAFLDQALECAYKAMKPGAAFYMFHADTYGHLVRQACAEAGLSIKQILVWAKNSFVIGRQDYQWQHEPIVYGWKPGAAHRWMSDRRQSTILEFDRPSKNVEHPTMKPVGLFAYLIGNNTCEGDIVLDLFGGSGTSMIACEQVNRRCYTMEYDPRYVDVIIDRWEQFTGQKAKKCDAERW